MGFSELVSRSSEFPVKTNEINQAKEIALKAALIEAGAGELATLDGRSFENSELFGLQVTEVDYLPQEYEIQVENEELPKEVGTPGYDDNGKLYKIDSNLLPNDEYVINGFSYKTDDLGRKTAFEGLAKYTPEAERDIGAQGDAGGEDRLPGDQGGHLVARIIGGSPGDENLVAMRQTINQGDYKRAENEIKNAVQQNQETHIKGVIDYSGESFRPNQVDLQYAFADVKKELSIDNVEGSKLLMNDLAQILNEDQYSSLKNEVQEMEADGGVVSLTSILRTFSSDDVIQAVVIGIRDEISGEKIYRTFQQEVVV